MSAQASVLEQLQVDIAARLAADSFFVDIPVYVLRPRASLGFLQIQDLINQTLMGLTIQASKCGVAVIVLMPLADGYNPDTPGPRLRFLPTVRVQEFPPVNMGPTGTAKTAEEVGLYVMQMLHQANFGNGNVLVAADEAMTPSDAYDPKLTIDCKFRMESGLAQAAQVATVLVAPRSGSHSQSVTMTCATVGASIYYTTNGDYPTAASGTIYSAPFTPAAACTIRAVAVLSGYMQSNISQGIYT